MTQRIFPGDFANVTYDAATCIATPLAADAGEDADASLPDASLDGGTDASLDAATD